MSNLTRREEIAARALVGILSNRDTMAVLSNEVLKGEWSIDKAVAKLATDFTDALLAHLDATRPAAPEMSYGPGRVAPKPLNWDLIEKQAAKDTLFTAICGTVLAAGDDPEEGLPRIAVEVCQQDLANLGTNPLGRRAKVVIYHEREEETTQKDAES